MATVGMKFALVCGTREMRGETLETLLDLGALELHRRSAAPGARVERQALIRLLERVVACADSDAYPAAPSPIPADLVTLARRLLEDADEQEASCKLLRASMERQRVWGGCSPQQVLALADLGVFVQCWTTDEPEHIAEITRSGTLLWVAPRDDRHSQQVFATLSRGEPLSLDWAGNLPLPTAGRAELEEDLLKHTARLASLYATLRWLATDGFPELGEQIATQVDALSIEAGRIQTHSDDHVFVLSGWIPETRVDEAAPRLRALPGVTTSFRAPRADEDPPTLTQYPAWARPIQSVFDFMGYRPGYSEYDAGQLIIVFFTVFSALLINDGGYGALLLTVLVVMRKRLATLLGDGAITLGLYVGVATMLYGSATGAFFGTKVDTLFGLPVLSLDTEDMIRVSFGLGIIHLSLGRLIQVYRLGWSRKTLAELGWLAMTWAVFLAIISVFTGQEVPDSCLPLLGLGAILVVLFSYPERQAGWAQLAGLGLLVGNATTLFSDMMSYIRLMAVGFASMSLAMTANVMAEQAGTIWAAAPILVLGHGINLSLGLIALFVHGLRLNTLEFARQLGVMWSGRPFQPMARFHWQE